MGSALASDQNGQQPSAFNYILSFILVGLAWGFTTPFIRRAAVGPDARQAAAKQQAHSNGTGAGSRSHTSNDKQSEKSGGKSAADSNPTPLSWLRSKLAILLSTVVNLLRTPAYTIPLGLNLTGSVWFFLLVGKHGT
jgi:hypothetical protein